MEDSKTAHDFFPQMFRALKQFKRFNSQKAQGQVIGIDLGTTNSCVAGRFVNSDGWKESPSY